VLFAASCVSPPDDSGIASKDSFAHHLSRTNAKVEQFSYSLDGSRIAYLSSKSGRHEIWVMDADGQNPRSVTPLNPVHLVSDGPSTQPRWSPDGEWISYRSRGLLFKVRSDGSAPPVNLTYGLRGSAPTWTPDGEWLVFLTGDASGYSQVGMIPSRIPDGPIEVTYLTDAPFNHGEPQVSPDGTWLAYTSDRRGADDIRGNDVWVKPMAGGTERLMTSSSDEVFDYTPRWSPDSSRLAFVSYGAGFRNIGVIEVATGDVRMLTDSPWDAHNPRWSPDGEWIAYAANKDWSFHIMKVGLDGGEPVQLTTREGVSGGIEYGQMRGTLHWKPDGGAITYTFMSSGLTSDLWSIGADGGEPVQLTDHMPSALADRSFVAPELISYASYDGLQIPAFLYRPPLTEGAGKPPLLLYARANTHGNHTTGFYPFIQYFLSRGFVVLAPQVRGSQGRGREFEWLNFGDWGGGDVDDLAAGADYLASEGIIDPERVVVQGGSTGGFFVMSLIQRYPDKVRAAVNFYGPTNLVHMYEMWAPAERPILGDVVGGDHGGPDEAPEHWRGRSAYFNIDAIRAPLLILWGDRDYSVRISMADEYFALAQEKQKPTEYHLYDDEPHGWYHWRPDDLEDALERVAAHYDAHIGQ